MVLFKYFICYLTRDISYGIIGHCKSARSLGALRTMLARHKVLLTSSISLRLPQPPRSASRAFLFSTFNFKLSTSRFPKFFPCHTSENSSVSPVTATDPKTPSRKPFACHTSETPRAGSQHSNLQPSNIQTIPQSIPFHFTLLRTLLRFFALFCAHEKFNSFLFKRFRTLCTKNGGGGEATPHNSPASSILWVAI